MKQDEVGVVWTSEGLDIDFNQNTDTKSYPVMKINNITGQMLEFGQRQYTMITKDIENGLKLLKLEKYDVELSYNDFKFKTVEYGLIINYEMIGNSLKISLSRKGNTK